MVTISQLLYSACVVGTTQATCCIRLHDLMGRAGNTCRRGDCIWVCTCEQATVAPIEGLLRLPCAEGGRVKGYSTERVASDLYFFTNCFMLSSTHVEPDGTCIVLHIDRHIVLALLTTFY